MKKIIAIVIVVLVIGLGIYYLSFKNGSDATLDISAPATQLPTVSETPAEKNSTSPAVSARAGAHVSIKDFSFSPSTISVKKGTKITWTNNDSVSHTVTPDSGNRFNSGNLLPGKSFSFIVTDLGSIRYHCAIHPGMKGAIVVRK